MTRRRSPSPLELLQDKRGLMVLRRDAMSRDIDELDKRIDQITQEYIARRPGLEEVPNPAPMPDEIKALRDSVRAS